MRQALIAAALAGLFANVYLFKRLIVTLAAGAGTPEPPFSPIPSMGDDGFAKRLLAPAAPVIAPSLVAFPVFWFAQTFEEAVLGMLLTSVLVALAGPALAPELLCWSHEATRMPPEEEAAALQAVRRLGVRPSEIWVTRTPIVAFWQPTLHIPSLLAGSRLLVWEALREMSPERVAGTAIGHRLALWPWAIWPIIAGAALRAIDSVSVLPWSLFAVPGIVVVLAAMPDVARWYAIRRSLRTDAAVPAAIRGFLDASWATCSYIAGQGPGPYHRMASRGAWLFAVRRARRGARLAGIPDAVAHEEIAASAAAPTPQ